MQQVLSLMVLERGSSQKGEGRSGSYWCFEEGDMLTATWEYEKGKIYI